MSRHRSTLTTPLGAVPAPRTASHDATGSALGAVGGGHAIPVVARPDLAHARRGLERVLGDDAADVWARLTAAAGVQGDEGDVASLLTLLTVMDAAEPVTRLCAQSLLVRLEAATAARETAADGDPTGTPAEEALPGSERLADQPADQPADRLTDRARLEVVASYALDDPELRREVSALCRRTAEQLGSTVSAITVVLDGATIGLAAYDGKESGAAGSAGAPAEWMFCSRVVTGGSPVVVPDAAAEPGPGPGQVMARMGLRSYAGVPLVSADGQVIGAHSVMRTETAPTTAADGGADVPVLEQAAAEIMAVLERYRRTTATATAG